MDQGERQGQLRRRGLMAGVAALAAGALAKLGSPGRVEAGHDAITGYSPGQVMHLAERNDGGNSNNDEVTTNILNETALVAFVGVGAALRVRNVHPVGSVLRADGGNSRIDFPMEDGGLGIIAQGGSSAQNRGGEGMAGIGGSGGRIGGAGVLGRGGSTGSGTGGVGVEGTGGPGSVASGWGVLGRGGGAGEGAGAEGVMGETRSPSNAGVRGRNFDSRGPGVLGQSGEVGTGSGTGVRGQSGSGRGVEGLSTGGTGVYGQSTSNYGIFGNSTNSTGVGGTSPNYIGVYGQTNGGVGVWGSASTGYAMYGVSTSGIGIYGSSGNYIGISASSGTSTGLYAASNSGLAAYFQGPVQVQGNFTVLPGFAKSVAVPHPDGSTRRMYCMESPESYFEDFGEGQLVNGRATVQLDRDFAAVVQSDRYRVFPVAEGDCKGLYVSSKSATGFEVREMQGGTSSVAFSYRVVAKRKDIAGPRMERVDTSARPQPPVRPRIQEPTLPPAPPAERPASPAAPERR